MDRVTFSKVDDMLFVGDIDSANKPEHLMLHSIGAVVQVIPAIIARQRVEGIEYLNIPVEDIPSENIAPYLPGAIDFIYKAQLQGKNVLVHCAAGISRSSSVACAYIMVKHNINFDEALRLIRKSRPIACPNAGFQTQLRQLPVQDIRRNYSF